MDHVRGTLVVLSGPAGSGKSSLANHALALDPSLQRVITATTRNSREGEIDGVDYHFYSTEQFLSGIENDDFLEYTSYNKRLYGSPRKEVETILANGKNALLVIDIKGAVRIRESYPDCVRIFLLPPTVDCLRNRLVLRKTETQQDLEHRLKIAETEVSHLPQYHYYIINDNLAAAVRDFLLIIHVDQRYRVRGNIESDWHASKYKNWSEKLPPLPEFCVQMREVIHPAAAIVPNNISSELTVDPQAKLLIEEAALKHQEEKSKSQ